MFFLGDQFQERSEDEGPLMEPGMRKFQGLPFEDQILVEEEIEIEGAVSQLAGADPSARKLYLPQMEEKSRRREGSSYLTYQVVEPVLRGETRRRREIDTRTATDPDASLFLKLRQGLPAKIFPVSEV